VQATLYADLVRKILSETPGGGPFQWPQLIQGDDVRIGLRFTKRHDAQTVEVDRTVSSFRCTLGLDDARPTMGGFKLKIGEASAVEGVNMTARLEHNASGDQVFAAINALSDLTGDEKPERVEVVNGSYRVLFKDGEQRTISLGYNTLFPLSFLRSRTLVIDDKTEHDLRLVQSPIAFVDSIASVVPAQPRIEAVIDGGTVSEVEMNEVQALIIPPEFRGTYRIKRSGKATAELSVDDDEEDIAEALKVLADEGGEYVCTLPLDNRVHIESTGTMGGIDQPLLEIEVFSAPPGDPTFNLSLNTQELAVLMNEKAVQKLPLEIEVVLENENDDELLERVTFRVEVELRRETAYEGLAAAQPTDWLRPPLPDSYVPVTEDQIEVGVRHYGPVLIGDGSLTSFVIDHDLDSDAITLEIWQNTTPGALLRRGTDYTVSRTSENSVTVTMQGSFASSPPALNALYVVVMALAEASQFNAHTHTIGQITGLQAILDSHGADILELQTLLGIAPLSADVAGETAAAVSWRFPIFAEVYPIRRSTRTLELLDAIAKLESLADLDLSKLPRTGGLLPAVHDAAVEDLPDPLPTSPDETYEGKVYENNTGETVTLPGGLGRSSVKLKDGQFAAVLVEDGRVSWFRVAKIDDSLSTFYPTDFDRTLLELAVNDKQLRIGKKLTVQCGLELAIFGSNTKVQTVLRIEHGVISDASTPGTPDANLAAVTWNTAEPILEQRLHLSSTIGVHPFGCVITRTAEGLEAAGLLYGASQAAGSAPATANFYLRARLVQFDTEDSEADPRGFLALRGLNASTDGAENATLGTAVITTA
jgi:hypothetical protein